MIVVSNSLLAAVVKWAHPDASKGHFSQVVFRSDEMIACDGHRLVRVPLSRIVPELAFGIPRADLERALAASAAVPPRWEDISITAEFSRGQVSLSCAKSPTVRIVTRLNDPNGLPPNSALDELVPPTPSSELPGGGIGINAQYLADVHEVAHAIDSRRGVRLVHSGGPLDPLAFEGPGGVRFIVMPMREL